MGVGIVSFLFFSAVCLVVTLAPGPCNSMQDKCFTKCIHRIKKDPDLAVGEMACVDRCVAKYLEVHDKVGEVYQKMQAGLQPQ